MHLELAHAVGTPVYCWEPHSPSQRPKSENTIGLLCSSRPAPDRSGHPNVRCGDRQNAVSQFYARGAVAEVDIVEFSAVIGRERTRLHMFVLRLSHSGKAIHVACANQAQESFLDRHVPAFAALGGVPTK